MRRSHDALASLVRNAAVHSKLREGIQLPNTSMMRTALRFISRLPDGPPGIVAKRRDRPYPSDRSVDWIKVKNPKGPAVTRCSTSSYDWTEVAEQRWRLAPHGRRSQYGERPQRCFSGEPDGAERQPSLTDLLSNRCSPNGGMADWVQLLPGASYSAAPCPRRGTRCVGATRLSRAVAGAGA